MKEEDIKANHKNLKPFIVKVEALFKCNNCDHGWSSHMATIVVDIHKREVDRDGYRQKCRECVGSCWSSPKFTERRFKEIMEGVTTKYWERQKKIDEGDNDDDDDDDGDDNEDDDDSDCVVIGDKHWGNPRSPHEHSLCERCKKLGKPCW